MSALNSNISLNDIVSLLSAKGERQKKLHKSADTITLNSFKGKVWLRGIIEYSNICFKNCYYCGIRKDNNKLKRYRLNGNETVEKAVYAWKSGLGSVLLQSGEERSNLFIESVNNIIKEIKKRTNGELAIVLSMGEQSTKTYKKWFNSGAHRYLLRIESSNKELYEKLHPNDNLHNFNNRLKAVESLKKVGFITGTGIMTGLPGQSKEDIAKDILFIKEREILMSGNGPYIVHKETPLFNSYTNIPDANERVNLTLNMIALLRILMPNINIAATTALDALDKKGRLKALKAGANVIMPNITPTKQKKSYSIYSNKPGINNSLSDNIKNVEEIVKESGKIIAYNEWGDPLQ
ncbi:[FeFe] hydrogenase H-cluster radical SAM maturase HydE [Marinilabiliaceae bacterium ANBcel2]|nr:[FeFe] hydrogenase H-cluster radical SAM maturase HydE [Marinilabiliaceae bacterium ANBcel2]